MLRFILCIEQVVTCNDSFFIENGLRPILQITNVMVVHFLFTPLAPRI